ncbi:hypothetical protein D0Z00_003868 [Geotrichum galactomycetum]|uniref:Uncharacterized protein n=1 Tax=Geotrichum galactomycetum TaxID=27317 RepID=A0ACB6V069_9ASCO|nr:hypothetical protein D0Z00_003868 [Geotrichum candidum]
MATLANPNIPALIFPETVAVASKAGARNRRLSLAHLLVVVYIYGGVSALTYLVSKTILAPLFAQLTYDRRDYLGVAISKLADLNVRLAGAVSYIPPIRESRAGEKYADAQTQTEVAKPSSSSSSSNESAYGTSVTATVSATSSKSVAFDEEPATPAQAAAARSQKLCSELTALSTSLTTLRSHTELQHVAPLKSTLDDSKQFADRLFAGADADKVPGTTRRTRGDLVTDIKKEIRTFKGSFLSARSFPTAYGGIR